MERLGCCCYLFVLTNGPSDLISVGIIVAGAFVAGARDLAFDAFSYSVVFIENMSKAVYLASVSRVGKISPFPCFVSFF